MSQNNNESFAKQIARAGTIEKTLVKTEYSRFIVDLRSVPVLTSDLISSNKDKKKYFRATKGSFFIKYEPSESRSYNGMYPYVLSIDLLPFCLRVKGPAHFKALKNNVPEIAWILKNTNFDCELFRMAKLHPGMMLPFCMNPLYGAEIERQLDTMGFDVFDVKPLVSFKFSSKLPSYYLKDSDLSMSKEEGKALLAKVKEIGDNISEGYETKTEDESWL